MLLVATMLHVLFAASWFGHKLLVPRDVRESVHNFANAPALLPRIGRAQALGLLSGIGTLGSGVWLTHLRWGLLEAPSRIYLGLAVVVSMFVVGAVVARPAFSDIRRGILAHDAPAAAASVKSFNRALTLESLLWIVALGTMLS